MIDRSAEKFLAMDEGRAAYRKWLDDPMTKLVFDAMEKRSRPLGRKDGSTALDHASANGFVAGVWHVLDTMRSLDELLMTTGSSAEQPQAGYRAEEG